MHDFNLYIYNKDSMLGRFGLCVIYDKNHPIPLIKEVIEDEAKRLYDYCLKKNIDIIQSNKFQAHQDYSNYCQRNNGYAEMSGVYLKTFYTGLLRQTCRKVFSFFKCSIVYDDNIEKLEPSIEEMIPAFDLFYYDSQKTYEQSRPANVTWQRYTYEYFLTSNELIVYVCKHTRQEAKGKKLLAGFQRHRNELVKFVTLYCDDSIEQIHKKLAESISILKQRNWQHEEFKRHYEQLFLKEQGKSKKTFKEFIQDEYVSCPFCGSKKYEQVYSKSFCHDLRNYTLLCQGCHSDIYSSVEDKEGLHYRIIY